MTPIPGRPNKPRVAKRYRVRTRDAPHRWLHSLDPLDPGRAERIRLEWREKESEGTIFTSRIYLEHAASRNPGHLPYITLVLPDAT